MVDKSFRDLEHAGWRAKANDYDDHFAKITNQAIVPILDSLNPLTGKRLLDVACGTGHLAGAAENMGAISEGIDFASTMVANSKKNFPNLIFAEGDAEQLPYEDARFDAITCSFGLLHLEQPEKAVKEAWRVLKKGGSYTFTTWSSPDQGGEFFALVMGAVQAHGTLDVPLPPAPPVFRFADPAETRKILTDAGFVGLKLSSLPLKWQTFEPNEVLELIYKSIVRIPLLLEAQTNEARESIHRTIIDGCEKYRDGDSIRFQFPALMATGRKL